MPSHVLTAGEIQAYIRSGAHLTPQGFRWSKNNRIAEKQIRTFAFIRGLQVQAAFLKSVIR
jgi:hypothetical protein